MSQIHWRDKYAPSKIDELILPEEIKVQLKNNINDSMMHMLLIGPPGVGKTTIPLTIAKELGVTPLKINASTDGSIDELRTTLKDHTANINIAGMLRKKFSLNIIIIDELEEASTKFMGGLKGFIEDTSKTSRFIATSNSHVIVPLISRMSAAYIDFYEVYASLTMEEIEDLKRQIFERVIFILNSEKIVGFEVDAIKTIIENYFPDYRRIINECQGAYQRNGLTKIRKPKTINEIIDIVVTGDLTAIYNLAYNATNERKLYDVVIEYFTQKNDPVGVLVALKDKMTWEPAQDKKSAVYYFLVKLKQFKLL